MRHNKISFTCLVIMSLILLALFSVLSFYKADEFTPNKASIVGGILGAIATTVLGFIAFWQNKRYKELSDELSERAYMPEIYMPNMLRDKLEAIQKSTYNSLHFKVDEEDTVQIDCGIFLILNPPILNIRIKALTQDNNIFQLSGKPCSLFTDGGFTLYLRIPKRLISHDARYDIVFGYENIYGSVYEKTAHFTLREGATFATNWQLEKAKKRDTAGQSNNARRIQCFMNRKHESGDSTIENKVNNNLWELTKNMISKHIVLKWAIISVLYALVIHILFHWEDGPNWLAARWSAGDILTYASTVSLGLLAIWQNQRFKEENDATQARLEKLTEQANEQAIINKIIEIESGKLSETKKAIDAFSEICDPVLNFPDMFAKQLYSEHQLRERDFFCEKQKRKIEEAFSELLRTMNVDSNGENKYVHSFFADAFKYKNAVINRIEVIMKLSHDVDRAIFDEETKLLYTLRTSFEKSENALICQREELLRQIVYDNLSKDEIRVLVNKEYASYKELVED